MKRGLDEIVRSLALIGRGLRLVWTAARGWSVAWGMLLLVQGMLPALLVYLTRVAVNRLSVIGTAGDTAALKAALPPLLAIALLSLSGQLVASLVTWVRTAQAELVQDEIQDRIHRQALALDLAFFDNPESYDLLHRARVEALSQPVQLLESVGTLVQNGLTLLVLAVMLGSYAPWLPVLLIGSALPGLWSVGRHVLREHRWRVENTSNVRRANYYDWMLTERASACEIRLFELGSYHRGLFRKVRGLLRDGRLALARDEMRAEMAAGAVAWLGGLSGMGWMLLQAARGAVRLGDLVLCYQAFQQGQKLMRSLLESAGRIYRSTLFLENLFRFLAVETGLAEPKEPARLPPRLSEVRFDRVRFAYPGSNRSALFDFSLTLPPGRITAIVGHNGAGKSTLVKLLCRFYDPQQGRITVDGVDLKDLDPTQLRRRVAVLFQEPVHYHTSAGDNIAMGDLASDPEPARVQAAARAAGADAPIARLPQGYQTVLGKWFGGAELSVGEWQRVALARAFLREADLVALDEPTSAVDSWAESDWLGRFRDLVRGRTALMITHRFTTAMHADLIHVMHNGRIAESGTHQELVAAGGLYARSWLQQMREVARG